MLQKDASLQADRTGTETLPSEDHDLFLPLRVLDDLTKDNVEKNDSTPCTGRTSVPRGGSTPHRLKARAKKLPHRTQAKEAARSSLPEHREHGRRHMMNPDNEGSSSPRSPSVRSLNEPPSVISFTGLPGTHTAPQHRTHKGHAPSPSAGRKHHTHWSLSRSRTVPGQQPASATPTYRSGNA